MANEKKRPVHEVRLGRIRAAIWENSTEKGVRHNVTISRLYKDGDDWRGRLEACPTGSAARLRREPSRAGLGHCGLRRALLCHWSVDRATRWFDL